MREDPKNKIFERQILERQSPVNEYNDPTSETKAQRYERMQQVRFAKDLEKISELNSKPRRIAKTSAEVQSNPTTLIGQTTREMRREAAKLIADTEGHPLKFLLNKDNEFRSSHGRDHSYLINHPELVQMGHILSKKSGHPERIMLQGAWENQLLGTSVEHPSRGHFVENAAIDIKGIAVDRRTAQFWEDNHFLDKGTVESAKPIMPSEIVFPSE
jgi:Bacterial toxin 5